MINNHFIYKFFEEFFNQRKKTNRVVVFSCRPFPNVLNYKDHWWNPPTIWKARLLNKTPQFSRTTIGIQLGSHAFDKLRFVMTLLTIVGITELICSFKLVLEGKAGKEIPQPSRLDFLEKFSANNFALSDAEDITSRLLNRRV